MHKFFSPPTAALVAHRAERVQRRSGAHVTDVDVATPSTSNNAAGLPVLYGGGLSDFQQALTGTDRGDHVPWIAHRRIA